MDAVAEPNTGRPVRAAVKAVGALSTKCVLRAWAAVVAVVVGGVVARVAAARGNRSVGREYRLARVEMIEEHDRKVHGGVML